MSTLKMIYSTEYPHGNRKFKFEPEGLLTDDLKEKLRKLPEMDAVNLLNIWLWKTLGPPEVEGRPEARQAQIKTWYFTKD